MSRAGRGTERSSCRRGRLRLSEGCDVRDAVVRRWRSAGPQFVVHSFEHMRDRVAALIRLAADLGDRTDAPSSASKPRDLDDQIDGGGDLTAYRLKWQFESGH